MSFAARCAAQVLPAVLLAATGVGSGPAKAAESLDAAAAQRFAALALACVHQEYPNKIAHVLNGDADVAAAARADAGVLRLLRLALRRCTGTGCWRGSRGCFPEAPFAARRRARRSRASLTPANIAAEVRYLRGAGRATLRAAVRSRLAAAARGRAARMGRPAGAELVGGARAAGDAGRGAPRDLAAEAHLSRSASASTARPRSRSA